MKTTDAENLLSAEILTKIEMRQRVADSGAHKGMEQFE